VLGLTGFPDPYGELGLGAVHSPGDAQQVTEVAVLALVEGPRQADPGLDRNDEPAPGELRPGPLGSLGSLRFLSPESIPSHCGFLVPGLLRSVEFDELAHPSPGSLHPRILRIDRPSVPIRSAEERVRPFGAPAEGGFLENEAVLLAVRTDLGE